MIRIGGLRLCRAALSLAGVLALGAALFLSACTAVPRETTGTALPGAPSPAGGPQPTSGATAARLSIYTPATTTSVPIILAAHNLAAGQPAGAADPAAPQLTVFSNHSQANTLFLRGDVDILVTGLSIGVGLFHNGAPIQVIDCNVSGLTYLVTYGRQVNSLAELKGEAIYVPFEGSPIEETTRLFAQREGLAWGKDLQAVYTPSDSALALLKQGKALAVALPEPFVTLAQQEPQVRISLSYREKWDALTGSAQGYPQVCAFARKAWLYAHPDTVARFNAALAQSIAAVQHDPAAAVQQAGAALGFAPETLLSALGRTDFRLLESHEMAQEVRHYYEIVGKPLDASYDAFFYGG